MLSYSRKKAWNMRHLEKTLLLIVHCQLKPEVPEQKPVKDKIEPLVCLWSKQSFGRYN